MKPIKAWLVCPTGYDNLTTLAMCMYFTRANAKAAMARGRLCDHCRIVRVEIREVEKPKKGKRT